MSNTLFPKFVLYRLRLLLELGARRQTLPAYLGSTVRGIFAASFRHVVCVTRAPVCDGCLRERSQGHHASTILATVGGKPTVPTSQWGCQSSRLTGSPHPPGGAAMVAS